jgi:hypothetical protein
MDTATTPSIRISDAAAAIGMETKALRNWFTKGNAKMFADQTTDRAWRTFSYADVACLAIMRQFVRFGFEVGTAEAFAWTLLTEALGPHLRKARELPPALFEAMLEGWKGVAYYLDKEDARILPIHPSMPDLPIGGAALVLELRPIVAAVLDALEAQGYDIGRSKAAKIEEAA